MSMATRNMKAKAWKIALREIATFIMFLAGAAMILIPLLVADAIVSAPDVF